MLDFLTFFIGGKLKGQAIKEREIKEENKLKEKNKYRIRGTVTGERDGQGVSSLRVEAWDKDLVIDDLLGSTKTNNTGRFAIK